MSNLARAYRTFVRIFRFLESFYLRQKTLDFKLKTKITGVLRKKRCILQKPQKSKYGCFIFAFSFSWQLLRYMIIYWTYEQTVSENVKGPLGKIRICERNADWILPRDTRSRYNHESLGHRVGICEIIYFGFNLKDKESSWWISF